MKVICIYHGNCADGFGAAWAVRYALQNFWNVDSLEFYPGVYQQPPPDVTGKVVVMVDFSYKRPVIEAMAKSAQSILILDHHKSAAEDLAGLDSPPSLDTMIEGEVMRGWLPSSGVFARFDMDKSGAMLAWEHFHLSEPPMLLRHIQDRDLWRFAIPGTREIQANVFSYPYDFKVWDELMETDTDRLVVDGQAIERKHIKDIKEFIEAAMTRAHIGGHIVPCLNAPYFWSSDAGHLMCKGHPFAACWWETEAGRVFSLRSDENGIDVSEVAKKYGGGGHKNAAGFTVNHDAVDPITGLPAVAHG
jgi:uncharacterized protein